MPRGKKLNYEGGDPYRNLAAAILLRAVNQAKGNGPGHRSAMRWLQGPDARYYAEMLDIDYQAMVAAIQKGRRGQCQSCRGRQVSGNANNAARS